MKLAIIYACEARGSCDRLYIHGGFIHFLENVDKVGSNMIFFFISVRTMN